MYRSSFTIFYYNQQTHDYIIELDVFLTVHHSIDLLQVTNLTHTSLFYSFHSFHWHVQNAVIPCRSQELLPFFPIVYFFLPLFSSNYASILPHFVLPSISWSTSWSCCFQIHTHTLLGILLSSILCTCPNQRNLCNLNNNNNNNNTQ